MVRYIPNLKKILVIRTSRNYSKVTFETINWGVVVMESSSTSAQVSGSGGGGQASHFHELKTIKNVASQSQSSIKDLAPNSNQVAEMGATYDTGSGVGMNKVNTGEAAQFNFSVETGKGGLVDEVF
tara:strand:+ start:134 stop:511 length:378 start_codon:yes stop_codon:yes gene_type:complete